ncbi:type I restriction enzyme, R subunit [Treponema bryantii]|uniref:Type I restriction enzyme, R subunit n=1 Tax=Treponema bryantii TaxID=163 RepID=A0A1H9GIQ4_9SPIR|nr:DEAD/DEAH box helicase family protein [Treponema bryantii]SEQ49768.1 type I restriction enzyme, R subunit [Treponema bryantii]
MNESDTRLKKIDPALKAAGWGVVEGSDIFTEQRAYLLTPGRIVTKAKRNPDKIDYLLTYKGVKIGIIEAKKDELDVSAGVEQAKKYAKAMNIRFTYSTNGDKIWAIDMEAKPGDFTEGFVERFPTPDELWTMTFPDNNEWRDKFNLEPFNRDGGKMPRYYQENAVNAVLEAVSRKVDRILLTLATGTGKTYIAFQICWKLMQTKWNREGGGRISHILFLADRNILADQAFNAFGAFDQNALARITPKEIRKNGGKVPMGQSIYFTIFQTMLCGSDGEEISESGTEAEKIEYYKQYPQDFFDFIIIDECHRGGANDESEWRKLMDYFQPAYQLGLTATPRRTINGDTYKYFGEPVYQYSLKQGIEDGYLTPYRVKSCTNQIIDEYVYDEQDKIVRGEDLLDKDKTYDEKDFYHGKIKIRERDELRVSEFLESANPDEKAIVFCATQNHAMQVRDMINSQAKRGINYCVRVTADDGNEGEAQLRQFQDNEKTIPTILTTSQKLSTGVDAQNVRNIVLMRPVDNMIEFKQIIGRGTRLFDDKYYFTIYDFVGAYKKFYDDEWDNPNPVCPICEKYPCECDKHPKCPKCGKWPCECKRPPRTCPVCGKWPCICPPKKCPVCGNLPCTCPKDVIEIELGDGRKATIKKDFEWEERIMYDGKLITLKEFVDVLVNNETLPRFFKDDEDLRTQWQNPETRKALLEKMDHDGFSLDKLLKVQEMLNYEKCDLLDVLEYLAYQTTPIEREQRVAISRSEITAELNTNQTEFVNFVLDQYIQQGYTELSMENLPELIKLKYGTINDAKAELGPLGEISKVFVGFQKGLYAA